MLVWPHRNALLYQGAGEAFLAAELKSETTGTTVPPTRNARREKGAGMGADYSRSRQCRKETE